MKSHFSNTHTVRNTCTDIALVVVDSLQFGRMESKAEAGRRISFEQPNYVIA
jgi:hypothetical protein